MSVLAGGGAASGTSNPRSAEIAIQQNVFDGFRTYNNVKGAEAQVEAVLLNAATAYMNVRAAKNLSEAV